MLETRKRARIVAARTLSPSVRSLSFAFADGPLRFEAGQWLNLYVPTAQGVQKRAYSIASAPHHEHVELAITLVADGAASPSLHGLEVGTELDVDGPHGFFTRDALSATTPSLYVATGTGLSPLRSMLLTSLHEGTLAPTTLLFGCRTQADILWGDELEALRSSVLRIEVTLSRPEQGWQGRTGYVQNHVAELARALGEPHVYICGLNHMVSAVRGLCKSELAYHRKLLHSERYD